uniref:Secreted protein n=1 Tax=Cacopsylla melanoneura TaxID=428564 RepID=A0A8D9FG64_9HEMI
MFTLHSGVHHIMGVSGLLLFITLLSNKPPCNTLGATSVTYGHRMFTQRPRHFRSQVRTSVRKLRNRYGQVFHIDEYPMFSTDTVGLFKWQPCSLAPIVSKIFKRRD